MRYASSKPTSETGELVVDQEMRSGRAWLTIPLVIGVAACSGTTPLQVPEWQLVREQDATQSTPVTLPTRLDDGRVGASAGRYWLRTRVAVPAEWQGHSLQLVVPEFGAVVRLRVDGSEAPDLSSADASGYRRRGPHSWWIGPDASRDGVLDLELVIEHRWTQSAWWGTVPRILPAGASDASATAVYVFNLLASAAALIALFQIGLTSVMTYLADRRRRPYLSFGVQGLIAAFYPAYVAGWTQRVFGTYDTPVLAITLSIAGLVSIQFTHDFFRLGRPWRGFAAMCSVVCLVSLVFSGPFEATLMVGITTVVFSSIVVCYQVAMCLRLVRRNADRRSALYVLISWLVLLGTGLPDFVWWVGLGDPLGGVRLASIGLGFFALCMSLLFSQQHIHSLRDSDDLNAELANRVSQLEAGRSAIELLNQELRRQIADRAAQIYAAVVLANAKRLPARALRVGEIIQGRYRVERPIGSGGMGIIYEVTRIGDGRRLALKLPREVHGESLARLAREAQMASTMSHSNIVAVVDVDVASAGFLFLVMELVDGTSLLEHRARYGDIRWVLPVLRQIAEGLAALHRGGIVHRDLKPANVLLTSDDGGVPRVKISDFGISLQPETEPFAPVEKPSVEAADALVSRRDAVTERLLPQRASEHATQQLAPEHTPRSVPALSGSSFLTRTGHFPGTPAYMAPEVTVGREMLTAAADMFAFGVIAYELIAGSRPFLEAPVLALLEGRTVPLPSSVCSAWRDAPPRLITALDACLSMQPGLRPSAAAVAELFGQCESYESEAPAQANVGQIVA